MRLVEPKNTIKTAIATLLFVALISQIIVSKPVNAQIDHKMANSTPKTGSIEEQTLENAENAIKLAFDQGEEEKPDKVMTVVFTAYTSTPDQTDDSPFIAASGKRVFDGMIASNCFPFGTEIKIPALYGDKTFVVEDRMNKRYGCGRMDIWMDVPRSEAMKFGVKRVVGVEIKYKKKVPKEIAKAGK